MLPPTDPTALLLAAARLRGAADEVGARAAAAQRFATTMCWTGAAAAACHADLARVQAAVARCVGAALAAADQLERLAR